MSMHYADTVQFYIEQWIFDEPDSYVSPDLVLVPVLTGRNVTSFVTVERRKKFTHCRHTENKLLHERVYNSDSLILIVIEMNNFSPSNTCLRLPL